MPSDLRTMGNPAGGRPLWLFKVLRRLGFKEIHCVEMHITENMLEVPKLNALGTKARPKPRSVFGDDDYLEGYGMAIVNLPPHMEEDLYGTLNALTTRLDRECRSDDTRRDWFEKILKQRLRYRMSKKWDEDDFDPVTLDPTGLSVEREEYQYGSAPELQVLARISQERDALRQQSHEEVDLPPHEAPIEEIDLDPLGRFVDDEPLTFTEQGLIHDGVELDGSVHELDLFRVIRATMPDRTVPEDNDVMLPGQSLVHNSRTAREEEELESDMLHRDILHQLAMEVHTVHGLGMVPLLTNLRILKGTSENGKPRLALITTGCLQSCWLTCWRPKLRSTHCHAPYHSTLTDDNLNSCHWMMTIAPQLLPQRPTASPPLNFSSG